MNVCTQPSFKDAPDAGSGGHGDSVQKEIVTPPEHERLNQKIQSGSQTLETSVPPREPGDTDNAGASGVSGVSGASSSMKIPVTCYLLPVACCLLPVACCLFSS